ncbi:hypothetical protein [Metabacillus fastidiosus]|uniref:hypothetical protein n=1 Tax=Metabacillus fastidiosus TaxID=1458 RepID=UPI003D2C7497
MNYSNGMGIEIPQYVITTKSAAKFWNIKEDKFVKQLTEDCLFGTPALANDKLKDLDFGYVVKTARKYTDSNGIRIRMS